MCNVFPLAQNYDLKRATINWFYYRWDKFSQKANTFIQKTITYQLQLVLQNW